MHITRDASRVCALVLCVTSFRTHDVAHRSANLTYANAGNTLVRSVPREHIRDKKEQQHTVVAGEVLQVVRQVEICFECLKLGCDTCEVRCGVCEASKATCTGCRSKGHRHWKPERRRCSRCEKGKCMCVRIKVYIIESDKEACNLKALRNLTSEGGELFGSCWAGSMMRCRVENRDVCSRGSIRRSLNHPWY